MFWVLFTEILRILKPDGLLYLNAPSNGWVHRYPVDCWRFYPDSGVALVNWARRCKFNPALLESYTSLQKDDVWNDFVAVFLKDAAHAGKHPKRILDSIRDFDNGMVYGSASVRNVNFQPEDMRKLTVIGRIVSGEEKVR
jgi:hypothetical protein